MKSIALVHFAYPPNLGGVEILMREHAKLLATYGHKVTVFTGSGKSKNPLVSLQTTPLFGSILNIDPILQEHIFQGKFDSKYKKLVIQELAQIQTAFQNIDTIIIHNMLTVSRNLAFTEAFHQYAATTKKNVVVYTHDHMYVRENQKVRWDRVNSQKEKELITRAIPHAQYVFISQKLKNAVTSFMAIPHTHVRVIPNGLNITSFLEIDPSIQKIVHSHHLLERFPIILSPVNLLRRKRIEYAIDIVAELKKEYSDICYIISGKTSKHRKTDDYEAEIMSQIKRLGLKKNVLFLSTFIERSFKMTELHDLYTLSDVVFYFSRHENFGIPIIEAPLTKTPIFTSNLDVFHEIAGSLLHYIDPDTIDAKAATYVIQKTLESQNIQLNWKMRKTYDLNNIIKKYLIPLI